MLLDEMEQIGHLPPAFARGHRAYLQQAIAELQKKMTKQP